MATEIRIAGVMEQIEASITTDLVYMTREEMARFHAGVRYSYSWTHRNHERAIESDRRGVTAYLLCMGRVGEESAIPAELHLLILGETMVEVKNG